MTESRGIGRGGLRVFRGARAKKLIARIRQLKSERERKTKSATPLAKDPD